MKKKKSFRFSPDSCNRLALLSSHFGITETSVLEHSLFFMSVVFEDLKRIAPDSHELSDFGSFFDFFGFAIIHFYQGGFYVDF